MIPQDVIEDILRRVSIVELISQYVPLKKSGDNYKGFCPFHNDKKNPSLSVSDKKGLYHCFSCGAGGNALTFLKEYNKLDFLDSIKKLGKMVGVETSIEQKTQSDFPLRNKIKEMHLIAQNLFIKQLFNFDNPHTEKAVQMIRRRKLDKGSIELFGLGYGGIKKNDLFLLLKKENFSDEEILESGLCLKTKQGKIYDRFRDRITFPIFDNEGTIIAFGGRALDAKNEAKYINSPETLLFKKGHSLYAWSLAKEYIFETGQVIIVEGYMDVIRMFQAGFKTALAPLGTGLTEEHLSFLKNKIDTLILCFDGDLAGQKSAYRSAGIAAKIGIPTKIIELPENDDPDTFLLTKGPNIFAQILNKKILAEDFVLETAKKKLPDTALFLEQIFEYAIYLEGEYSSPSLGVQTEQFLKKCAQLIMISYSAIELEFLRFKEEFFKYEHEKKSNWQTLKQKKVDLKEENATELLAILIMFPEFIKDVAEFLEPSDFPDNETQEFFKKLLMHPEYSSSEWIVMAGNKSFIKKTSKWSKVPEMRIIKNYTIFLRIESLKQKKDYISKEIIKLTSENKEYEDFGKELLKIQSEITKLKNYFYHL